MMHNTKYQQSLEAQCLLEIEPKPLKNYHPGKYWVRACYGANK